ncbi:MAG: hypothetical protein MJZ61_08500 [Bacteroidales bacterium]|nr:hypothetical protein [Bacteroidales bacterium]
MKKQILTLSAIAMIFASCGNSPKQQQGQEQQEAQENQAPSTTGKKVDWRSPLYTLNEKGDTIEKWSYNENGKMLSKSTGGDDPYVYYYDDHGNIETFISDHGDNVCDYSYTYNDKGEILTYSEVDETYSYTYEYDDKGRIIRVLIDGEESETRTYNDDKTIEYHTPVEYWKEDEEGRRLEYDSDGPDGMSEEYEYNGNCMTVKSIMKSEMYNDPEIIISKTYFLEK